MVAYLAAAFRVFFNPSFRYVREIVRERDAMLEFETTIDGVLVNGVDLIRWNEDHQITEFKVMVRPLKAIQLIHERMAAMLAGAGRGPQGLAGAPTPHRAPSPMPPSPDRMQEFLDAFEEVFDRDWTYTSEMLGIQEETASQRQEAAKFGLEAIPVIAEGGTFLRPGVDDEVEDWGNRARLLAAYRALRNEVSGRSGHA